MRRFSLICALWLVTTCAACAASQTATTSDATPTEVSAEKAGHPDMSWKEVKSAMAAGAVLVDARGAKSYAKGHIPGAISVPLREPAAMERLPGEKSTKLIFYCGGPQCTASTQVADKAIEAGYTDVTDFRGGFPAWRAAKGLDGSAQREAHEGIELYDWTQTAAAMSAGGMLIDSRSPRGFNSGHITGAINVPYKDEAAHSALPSDKATTLVFYCSGPACSASTKGAKKALEMGYTQVKEYRGGYPDWASRQ